MSGWRNDGPLCIVIQHLCEIWILYWIKSFCHISKVNAPANTFLRVNECNCYFISHFIEQITASIYSLDERVKVVG